MARLEADGPHFARFDGGVRDEDYVRTQEAMRHGYAYFHHASLSNYELRSSADLLERIEIPSRLGSWSYIPIECKLSSHSKPIYLVQACAYCELLEPWLHRSCRFRGEPEPGRVDRGNYVPNPIQPATAAADGQQWQRGSLEARYWAAPDLRSDRTRAEGLLVAVVQPRDHLHHHSHE